MNTRKMFVLLAAALAACDSDSSGPAQETPREQVRALTVQESKLAEASVGFGLKLFQETVARDAAKPNLMVSPLSVSLALGMTMNGAEGTTYDAMRNTLGFGSMSEAEINEGYKGLIAQLLARDPKLQLKIANSVWIENRFEVEPPFTSAARNFFNADVRKLDFADPAAPRTISNWAEQQTNGKIKDLIQEISRDEVMFLVNAVYFNAAWTHQFDPRATSNQSFTREAGGSVSVPTMSRRGLYRTVQNSDVVAAELLYGDSAFSMLLVMPASGSSIAPLAARLNPSFWNSLVAALRPGDVILSLPKFKFEYEKRLNDQLTAAGMGIIFSDFADFDRINRQIDLVVSRVQHKTFIDVNEVGTEAAAATAVGIAPTSMPPEYKFNRPFLFAIRERSTGAILFMGKVGDPTIAK